MTKLTKIIQTNKKKITSFNNAVCLLKSDWQKMNTMLWQPSSKEIDTTQAWEFIEDVKKKFKMRT